MGVLSDVRGWQPGRHSSAHRKVGFDDLWAFLLIGGSR